MTQRYTESIRTKKGTNEFIYKTEIELQMQNKLMVTRGQRGGGINWRIRIDIHTQPYIKQVPNKDLLRTLLNTM